MNVDKINKSFILVISILNILTTTSYEFKIFGLETSYEFIFLILWISFDICRFFFVSAKINYYRLWLIIFSLLFFFMFIFEFFIKDNFKAVYEINFIILLYSIYQFQKVTDFKYLMKISLLITIILALLLLFTETRYSETNWDFRELNKILVQRKSLYGYVSITLSFLIALSIIFLMEIYQKKEISIIIFLPLISILIFYLLFTFSRTGIILLIIYYLANIIPNKNFKISKYWIKLLLFIRLIFFVILSLDIFDEINYFELFEGIFSNIRIKNSIENLTYFISGSFIDIIFGNKFFSIVTDNTIVAIIIGKGVFGFIVYFFMFYFFIKEICLNKNLDQIKLIKVFFTILFVGFLLMDFFGQRKILFLFALYLTTLISYYEKNNSNIRRH